MKKTTCVENVHTFCDFCLQLVSLSPKFFSIVSISSAVIHFFFNQLTVINFQGKVTKGYTNITQ